MNIVNMQLAIHCQNGGGGGGMLLKSSAESISVYYGIQGEN